MTSNSRARAGFTLIELVMIIIILSALAVSATSYFLDFRFDARKATAINFINYLEGAIRAKKVQMGVYCTNATGFPRFEGIMMNDVTEGGNPSADCLPGQLPKPADRKFLADAESPIVVPVNPYTNLTTFQQCACTDLCDASCTDTVGFCYNRATGNVWGKGLRNCP